MKAPGLDILWGEEVLTLLPERAIWWARKKTLFIADPHFGKASAFRAAGIAVPETSHDDDLARLTILFKRHSVKQLVVLGDFFHAKAGRSERSLTALKNWRRQHDVLEITLVIGNHDRRAGCPPEEWNIQCVNEPWMMEPFSAFHHPPEKVTRGFALAGHWHPGFRLYERSGISATSVCFYFKQRLAILPAFGNFTGKHLVRPERGERIFLIGDDQIIEATQLAKFGF